MQRSPRFLPLVLTMILMNVSGWNGPQGTLHAQTRELRGVWYTPRSGSSFVAQSQIAAAMDTIKKHNFNTVFFNVWSQGYPLFRSSVFQSATGGFGVTDPNAGTRDLLAEAIVEAHRCGLEIEAWFEYGFIGGYSGNKPTGSRRGVLLDAHPSWVGRSSGGIDSISLGGGQSHFWMSNEHSEVKRFLIDLAVEVADRYDVDGIELDRVRYPTTLERDWGYDSATVAVYTAEKGVPPPANPNDAGWMRWRADKLNAFHKAAYDSIKARHPFVLVTNAPSHYSSSSYYAAYQTFLQDWAAWINDGYLDAAHLQQYTSVAADLPSYISSWKTYRVTDPVKQQKVFPGIAAAPNSVPFSASDFLSLIQATRSAGLGGNAIWYYNDLDIVASGKTFWSHLSSGPYATFVPTPLRIDTAWRPPPALLSNLDSSVVDTTGSWLKLGGAAPLGFFGRMNVALSGPPATISYHATPPYSAYYDSYAYLRNCSALRTTRAPYDLYDSSGTAVRTLISQQDPTTNGWVYLGTRFLRGGSRVRVVRLSNDGIEPGLSVVDGGVMLLVNRRLSPGTPTSIGEIPVVVPDGFELSEPYPNPFNPCTTVSLKLPHSADVAMTLFDMLGRSVRTVMEPTPFRPGVHDVRVDGSGLSSGLYVLRVSADSRVMAKKLIVLK